MAEDTIIQEKGENPLMLMDTVIEKLKIINYQTTFCKMKSDAALQKPLTCTYFVVPHSKPSEQFYYFTSLVSFLMGLAGNVWPAPAQFDDPNVTNLNLLEELKKMGFNNSFPPNKLNGHGEVVLQILNTLMDRVFQKQGFRFRPPIHPIENQDSLAEDGEDELSPPDESIVDDAGEDNALQDLEEAPAKEVAIIESKVSSEEWRLEVERVTPALNSQKLGNEKSDWRNRLEKLVFHQKTISQNIIETKGLLDKMTSEIKTSLDQLETREKYMNTSFDYLIDEYKAIQTQATEANEKFSQATIRVNSLTNELQNIEDETAKVKKLMDNQTNAHSDTGPLVKLKSAMQRIREEIGQFEVRIGVVENTLLQAKIRSKRHSPFAR